MKGTFRRVLLVVAVVIGAGLILSVGGNALASGGGPFGWPYRMGGGRYNPSAAGLSAGGRYTQTLPYGRYGRAGMMGGGGMMGFGYGFGAGVQQNVQPLSIQQATSAVNSYLAQLGNPDLVLAHVMIFSNNAYARIEEKSTGIGAFELLVNPVTLAVTPEPGPNMMWNTKYSPMYNVMGWRMGGSATEGPSAVMPVSASDALKNAQSYLDQVLPGTQVAGDEIAHFYGYYTIDFMRDDKTVGMLSVNGYSGQVFLHTWHGTFITESANQAG